MNGFQLGFIESILEISSCHLRIEEFPLGARGEDLEKEIRSLPGIRSVLPFREMSVLLRTVLVNPRGALIRGLPSDALELDPGLQEKLELEEGFFDIDAPDSIVLGAELARHLSVRVGDRVNLLSFGFGGLSTGEGDGAEGTSPAFTVTGIFRCGFYEYDLGWAYININSAADLAGREEKPVLGIKLQNRWQDAKSVEMIQKLLTGTDALQVISWRDYNRAFFGALRTEKLMMFILVGLIFIVVGLNIFQAQRRTVLERREEIGLLRALGASDRAVRLVFVWDGFIIGFTGAGAGLGLGLFIAFHISVFFSFLEGTVNFFIRLANLFLGLFGSTDPGAASFAVFSPQVFYLKEIPSRIIPHEVVLIFLFGFLSALLAAWFASGRAARTRPAEVLRYE
jgi:lipoprotein-releasing system permease protein